MGSLMAGWDSRISDPKTVSLKRNRSFTKEQIESFWRWYKPSRHQHQQHIISVHGKIEKPQSSLDLPDFMLQGARCHVNSEIASKTNGWWTKSNWAFLNEPPQEEINGAGSKYAAQFHVAQFHTNKCTMAN